MITTQIAIEEYLASTYSPDREYLDGELRERNVGKWEHARIQALLALWFGVRESEWHLMVATEQRVQVSPTRVRIPDVVLVSPGSQPDVLRTAPSLVIEILSPDDSYSDTQERARDYFDMGVPTVWIIDPRTRSGRVCEGDVWACAERMTVSGSPVYVELSAIFSGLDKVAAN